MSSIGMSILFSSSMTELKDNETILVQKREGPFDLDSEHGFFIQHKPDLSKKVFIYEYDRNVAQKKVYGKLREKSGFPFIEVYEDKELNELGDITKQYIIDYYYEYKDEALLYTIEKERFNGLFTLEGKFYSKDENDGLNYTNLIYMPKVRVVSDINLRLGEKADPTTSVFNIIGLPESVVGNRKGLILEITRLSEDIDAEWATS